MRTACKPGAPRARRDGPADIAGRASAPPRHVSPDMAAPRAGIPLEGEAHPPAIPHTGDIAGVFHCRDLGELGSKELPMMSLNQSVHRVAIVGTGVIGASWAAYYLSRGFDVVAADPGPQSRANLRKYVND